MTLNVKFSLLILFRFGHLITRLGFFAHFGLGHCANVTFFDPWEIFYDDYEQSRSDNCTGICVKQVVELVRRGGVKYCYSFPHCAPKAWTGLCKNGKFQSPIDLDIKSETLIKKTSPKKFLSFDKFYREDQSGFLITNNGHSITVYFNNDFTSESTFSHTDTNLQYSFAQLHFHWSTKTPVTTGTGSEHTLGKKRFPMEMHLVHYKTEYETMGKAVKQSDNLALGVLGIFFEIGEEENLAMKPIVDAILEHSLKESAGTVKVEESINLFKLLPKDLTFFRYRGSLTIPACAEKLNWVVFTEAIEISKEQMSVFMQVESTKEKDGKLKNYRPMQAINGRKIEYFG